MNASLASVILGLSFSFVLIVLSVRARPWLPRVPGWVRPSLMGGAWALAAALSPWAGLVAVVLAASSLGPAAAVAALVVGVGALFLTLGSSALWWLAAFVAAALGSLAPRILAERLIPMAQGIVVAVVAAMVWWLLGWDADGTWPAVAATLSAPALGWLYRDLDRRGMTVANLRRTNRQLASSQQSSRTVLNALHEAVFLYGLDGTIVDANQAMLELYEIERLDQVIGTSPLDYAAPDNRPDLALDPLAEPHPGRTLAFEWQCRTMKSKRVFPAEVRLTRIDYAGRPHLMATVTDRTERRDLEVELKALRTKRDEPASVPSDPALTRRYLDLIEVMVVILDKSGTITLLNRKAREVLQSGRENLEGKDWFGSCVPGEHADHWRVLHGEFLSQPTAERSSFDNEIVTASGERRLIAWTSAQVLDAKGQVVGRLCSGEDITEKRAAERQLAIFSGHLEDLVTQRTRELEEARDQANAANEAKSLFLANMSHEIRTPMNAVLGFAQLLAKEPGLSPEARHKTETIVRSGEHLLAIINDILEMSRIEAGGVDLKSQNVALHDVLKEVAGHFGPRAVEKGLTWTLNLQPELPRVVLTDPVRIRQVLTNLIGNAVKFTDTGSVAVTAGIVAPGRAFVEVADSGIGIPLEERTRLFQPFERTRSGKSVAGGTGLGLAISRRFAQLLGGDVEIVDKGTGACFRFEFAAPEGLEGGIEPAMASDLPLLEEAHRGTLILVVDDLRANRELLKGMLEPQGYTVLEASDGREAIKLVDARSPRIVLMGLLMPNMDGFEATRRIRQAHARDRVAVIGITASAFPDERSYFESSGLDAFLTKPFLLTDLHDLINRVTDLNFSPLAAPEAVNERTNAPLPPEWVDGFREALAQGNITRLRQLGEASQSFDPGLSTWISERAARYELDDMKTFLRSRGVEP